MDPYLRVTFLADVLENIHFERLKIVQNVQNALLIASKTDYFCFCYDRNLFTMFHATLNVGKMRENDGIFYVKSEQKTAIFGTRIVRVFC